MKTRYNGICNLRLRGNVYMSNTMNIIISVIFGVASVVMFYRWSKVHRKIMIHDQQWSYLRIMVLVLGVLTAVSLVLNASQNTMYDYARIAFTFLGVTAFMALRDGVGEEGMVSVGKFYPWNEVTAYDYSYKKNTVEVYFMVKSQKKDKPDEYTTKVLEFANENKDHLMKFLQINLGRKYTRMKRKK